MPPGRPRPQRRRQRAGREVQDARDVALGGRQRAVVAYPALGPLGRGYRAFEWHHYNFGLPPGAVELAVNAAGNQAYRVGPAAWGLQFHIEVDRRTVEWWMDVGEWNLDEHGADKDAIRADTDLLVEDNARAAEALARRFVEIARDHGRA